MKVNMDLVGSVVRNVLVLIQQRINDKRSIQRLVRKCLAGLVGLKAKKLNGLKKD